MDHEVEDVQESGFQYQAESFEAFLSRYWIENEILVSQYDSPLRLTWNRASLRSTHNRGHYNKGAERQDPSAGSFRWRGCVWDASIFSKV